MTSSKLSNNRPLCLHFYLQQLAGTPHNLRNNQRKQRPAGKENLRPISLKGEVSVLAVEGAKPRRGRETGRRSPYPYLTGSRGRKKNLVSEVGFNALILGWSMSVNYTPTKGSKNYPSDDQNITGAHLSPIF